MQTIIEPLKNNDIRVSAPVTITIPFEALLATIEALPDPQKWQIYQTLSAKFASYSAEAKAISRLPDQDDPSKWITSIEEDEQIDEPALNAWLEKKGCPKGSDITTQNQELTLNDLISTVPNNFQYPDDVREFTESEPLGRELL